MRTHAPVGAMLLVILLAGPGPIRAQVAGAPDSLDFDSAVERALARAPEAELHGLEERAASARARQAGRGLNPELSLEFEEFGGVYDGFSEMDATATLTQRLERGGKRSARQDLAESEAPLVDRARRSFRLDRALEVRRVFLDGLAAQARLGVAEEHLALARELLEAATLKVRAGAVSPVETVRAEALVRSTEIEQSRARRSLDLARRQMAALLAEPVPGFSFFAGRLDTLRLETVPPDSAAMANSPQGETLRLRAAQGQARLAFEESLGSSDLDVGVGVRHSGTGDGLTFLAGLSVPLPFRDRNQDNIDAARLDRERLAAEAQALRLSMEREFRALDGEVREAQLLVRALRRNVIPLAEEGYRIIRESYRQGRMSFLDVYEARRQLIDARAEEIDALLALQNLDAERRHRLGLLIPDPDAR